MFTYIMYPYNSCQYNGPIRANLNAHVTQMFCGREGLTRGKSPGLTTMNNTSVIWEYDSLQSLSVYICVFFQK